METIFLISFPRLDDFCEFADVGEHCGVEKGKLHDYYESGIDATERVLLAEGVPVFKVQFDRPLYASWLEVGSFSDEVNPVPLWAKSVVEHSLNLTGDPVVGVSTDCDWNFTDPND